MSERATAEVAPVWQPRVAGTDQAVPHRAGSPGSGRDGRVATRHGALYGVGWAVFGCVALVDLAFQGVPALLWLVPTGLVLALVGWVAQTPGTVPALEGWVRDRRAWLAVHAQVRAAATWSDGHCTWCGSAARHRGPDGVAQPPAVFHQTEITAEAQRRRAL